VRSEEGSRSGPGFTSWVLLPEPRAQTRRQQNTTKRPWPASLPRNDSRQMWPASQPRGMLLALASNSRQHRASGNFGGLALGVDTAKRRIGLGTKQRFGGSFQGLERGLRRQPDGPGGCAAKKAAANQVPGMPLGKKTALLPPIAKSPAPGVGGVWLCEVVCEGVGLSHVLASPRACATGDDA